MPNISFIKSKPEPLGTEFKNIVNGMTGQMLWLEIQEGKDRMKTKDFQGRLGGTAACVMRGVKASENLEHIPNFERNDKEPRSRLFFADSWFGSVKTVATLGLAYHHTCMTIKTAHVRSPIFY